MTDKQRLDNELKPLIREGLLRNVLNTNDFEVYALCENGYIAFPYGEFDNETGLNVFALLTNREFEMLMETPLIEMLRTIITVEVEKGQQKLFVFTDELLDKFREIKQRVEANPQFQVNKEGEQALVKQAEEVLRTIEMDQSTPGMGGR